MTDNPEHEERVRSVNAAFALIDSWHERAVAALRRAKAPVLRLVPGNDNPRSGGNDAA